MGAVMKSWIAQVRKGLVELCVLAALAEDEAYGYQLLQRLAGVEGLAITESTVYPILSRLTDDGLLAVRAALSPAGPPRRYYRLTPLGRARLREMAGYWRDLQTSVDLLLKHVK
jgi:PadR family transcriptional regulator, regulatory protein PadR